MIAKNPAVPKNKLKNVLGYRIIHPAKITLLKFQYGCVFFMGNFFIMSVI
jgi:hypothetical protein